MPPALAHVNDADPVQTATSLDPDARIMARVRDGDQEAVVDLVHRYQDELTGFFYHLSWDQLVAEELAQDVFVNAYRARERWVPTARVRTWLYRIAHNLWIDHLRRQKRHLSLDAEMGSEGVRYRDLLPAAEVANAAAEIERRAGDIRARVQTALAELPDGQRAVFVLANNHGMKYQDIAQVLGIPEGTVKSRMHGAVRILRELLRDLVEP